MLMGSQNALGFGWQARGKRVSAEWDTGVSELDTDLCMFTDDYLESWNMFVW